MTEIKEALDKINNNLRTVGELIQEGSVLLSKGKVGDATKWVIQPLYQKNDCSLGFARCEKKDYGDYPDHVHCDAKEYVVCVRGSAVFYINGLAMRAIKEGECVSVPIGIQHKFKPLVDDTKLFYICVPADKTITGGCEV